MKCSNIMNIYKMKYTHKYVHRNNILQYDMIKKNSKFYYKQKNWLRYYRHKKLT